MKRPFRLLFTLIVGCSLCTGCVGALAYLIDDPPGATAYRAAGQQIDDDLPDDRWAGRTTPAFDPLRTDRAPRGEWVFNQSAAVFRLNITPADAREEKDLQILHPSFGLAIAAAKNMHPGMSVLPSVNLLDGKAKQFDDGLYAALDLAYYQGFQVRLKSHVELIRRMYDGVDKDGAAAPFLAAGLEIAGVKLALNDVQGREHWLKSFRDDEVHAKPIGFYTWNDELRTCFRFLRFFQKEFETDDLAVPRALAAALDRDPALKEDYRRAVGFYAKLSNPPISRSLLDVPSPVGALALPERIPFGRRTHEAVAVLPSATARETVLFEKLFPDGLPPDANLMRELIHAIRSGKVDLKPGKDSGWYDYQVYALETLLLPEKGPEREKLLLTHTYKKRMVEAFQALITKQRETHVREMSIPFACAYVGPPPEVVRDIRPRLRLEPCPSYYLRTARAYSFLANFLEASVGKDALQRLHGLRQDKRRDENLYAELQHMRELFYGFYLVCAEDIGLKPDLAVGEVSDSEQCFQMANAWLSSPFDDLDLWTDTRVAVPIFENTTHSTVHLWVTLGVRVAKLNVEYAQSPHIRPKNGGEWEEVSLDRLAPVEYLVAVDEFAEVERRGMRLASREELRAICNREKTKEAIVAELCK